MATFTTYSDEEIKRKEKEDADNVVNFLPNGRYHFKVEKTEDGISKAGGNFQFVLGLRVFSGTKTVKWLVNAYLLPNHPAGLQIKFFKDACKSVNILKKYESGDVEHFDFKDRNGEAEFEWKKADNKEDTYYGKVTAFYDYVQPVDADGNPIDEEIPF